MDENLEGIIRTGTITLITANGVEKKIAISQLPAIPIGMYDYQTLSTIDKGNYDQLLYTEQLYEYKNMRMPYFSAPNKAPLSKNGIYNGWNIASNNSLLYIVPATGYPWEYYDYPAINYCANKNRGVAPGSEVIHWHLPSQAQLMAMYVFYNVYNEHPDANFLINPNNPNGPSVDPFYWSSTVNETYTNPKEAQYVDFRYGNTGHQKSDVRMIARCVRSKGDRGTAPSVFVNTTYPTIDFSLPYPSTADSIPLPIKKEDYYTTETKMTPVHSVAGDGTEIGNDDKKYNRKVFKKLRVAVSDASTANVTWAAAAAQCASYSETGATSGWRLPTQRELMAIWIVQDGIKDKYASFNYLGNNYYWSATESSQSGVLPDYTPPYSNAWMVFGSRTGAGDAGNTPHYLKTEAAARARCVKEILD
jgi:hypothetical protein